MIVQRLGARATRHRTGSGRIRWRSTASTVWALAVVAAALGTAGAVYAVGGAQHVSLPAAADVGQVSVPPVTGASGSDHAVTVVEPHRSVDLYDSPDSSRPVAIEPQGIEPQGTEPQGTEPGDATEGTPGTAGDATGTGSNPATTNPATTNPALSDDGNAEGDR